MKARSLVMLLAVVCATSPAEAYVEPVHRLLTERAFDRALVDWQMRLGLSDAKDARVWMSDGAFDEDHPGTRVLNHFYDPIHEAGLMVRTPIVCGPVPFLGSMRADLWATQSLTLNVYSTDTARQWYYTALTGPNPGTRRFGQKELFLTLGHLAHLVQDMAQPEHTRNDVHLTINDGFDQTLALLVGEPIPSVYEAWAGRFVVGEEPTVALDGYPNVKLRDYSSYFHTLDGRGLADYSNRNFLTQDTNYGDYESLDALPKCFEYSSPSKSATTTRIEPEVTYAFRHANGECCFYRTVYDETAYSWRTSDGDFDHNHSHQSSLDLETLKYDPEASFYSLSDASYQRRADLLIPRAVGYSAGFIDHFFRGKIDAKWKRTKPGALFSHEVTITNLSEERIGSDASITADYRVDPAYFNRTNSDDTGSFFTSQPLSDLVPGFDGLDAGESVTLTMPFVFGLHDGDSISQFERRIAIKGTLGTEQDAVIGLVQSPEWGGVKVEVTWTPVNAGMTLQIINGDINGNGSAGYAKFFSNAEQWESNVNGDGGIVDIVNPTVAGGPMSIAVLEAALGNYYTWSLIGHIPGSSVLPTAEVTVTVDGKVVSKSTIAVPPSYTRIWQYP